MPSVLLIEDDGVIARSIGAHLRHGGLDVEWAEDGERGLRKLRFERPDVAVVDLMLPGLDGWTVTERARAEGIVTPIIVISARGSEHDKVHALEIGADDYLAKPFSPNELVARVRALLRRARRGDGPAPKTLTYGPIALDADRHIVSSHGRDVTLTAKEFLLLEYLLQHRGRVLSRDVLLTDVWGYRYTGGTRTVDVHVRRLREKLPVLADGLVTVKQFGYKLVDPVA